jgi:hypothetical protein
MEYHTTQSLSRRSTATLALISSFLLPGAFTAPVQAQQVVASPGAQLPVSRTQRELVEPEGYVRIDLGLTFGDGNGRANDGIFFAHDLGGGVGLVENFEVGVSLNREWFWPRVGGGLVPILYDGDHVHFHRIPIYARYQFVTSDHVAIAGDLEFNLATHAHGRHRHQMRASLPVRLRGGSVMFDTGFTFELETNDAQANFYTPAVFAFNATEALFFRVATGFGVTDMRKEGFFMPLFFGGGYTFPVSTALVDVSGDFGFPFLAHHGERYGPGANDRTSADFWMFKVTVAVHLSAF